MDSEKQITMITTLIQAGNQYESILQQQRNLQQWTSRTITII